VPAGGGALAGLTELSRSVAEIANVSPNDWQPYVGRSAFAHKGGVHGAAVAKVERSYQHIDPTAVGNAGRLVVSELAIAMGLAPGETTNPAASETPPTPDWSSLAVAPPSEPTPRLTNQVDDRSRPVQPTSAHPAEPPRPRPRRWLYPAIAVAAVAVVTAAVILGINIGSTPRATPTPAAHSPTTASSPATAHAPAQGNFTIDRQISNDGQLVLTLTTIKLRANVMTVNVAYHNISGLPQILSCVGDNDPSAAAFTPASGIAIDSTATYCSDHPSAAFTLNAGATHTSYSVFHVPAGFPEPFTFTWTTGTGSSTVSNLKL